jgi:hypothetical protein
LVVGALNAVDAVTGEAEAELGGLVVSTDTVVEG